jgi:hypothetical protein
VLLREQIAGDNTPPERKRVVEIEIGNLYEKRAALEDVLDPQAGGA